MKRVKSLVSLSQSRRLSKTRVGVNVHLCSHVFESTLVHKAVLVGRNEKMWEMTESGKLLILSSPISLSLLDEASC